MRLGPWPQKLSARVLIQSRYERLGGMHHFSGHLRMTPMYAPTDCIMPARKMKNSCWCWFWFHALY
jgi:hypothetical protein